MVYLIHYRKRKRKEDILMNKSELVDSIAQKTGLTKKDSEAALNAFVESVTETLKKRR